MSRVPARLRRHENAEGELSMHLSTASNKRMNLTVRPVTRLAVAPTPISSNGGGQGACPSRPAGYPRRSTDLTRSGRVVAGMWRW